jgi:hypothetical protein
MGDGARRLALAAGTFKVVARRTLRCEVDWFVANPVVTGDVTAEGGGVGGSGGEGGLFELFRKGCGKKSIRRQYFIWVEMTDPKAPSEREAT